MNSRRLPWVTAATVLLALASWAGPAGWPPALVYDRTAILHGELWRLWTGHLVHFSSSHLGWDLLAVALTGIWIEGAGFRGGRWLYLAAPPAISCLLLIGDPALQSYGGLSGLATAGAVFACLSEWQRASAPRALWGAALAAIAMKCGWDLLSNHPLFAQFGPGLVRPVPLSHLAGGAAAVVVAWLARLDRRYPLRHGVPAMPAPHPSPSPGPFSTGCRRLPKPLAGGSAPIGEAG